ncbi:unnamed protein product [Bursaphelenchus xylophilus]|uniref:(pine wood nematode) hypothetical protein n=1 Tax=Bursaphelenchus xylophilus TaxID=6326 RepID=A0A7I8XEE6_BURXY|nr:unnamed protein product [Bursaphelenchus xylophilus]CAG9080575.1 unnamed protein product [Bursaphelenchus xylophilus]
MRLFVIFFFLFIAIASAFEAKDEVPCSDDSQCAQKQCPPGETAKCVDMGKKLLGSTRFTMRLFVIFFFLFIAIASAIEVAKDEVPCSDDSQCSQKQCPPGETAKCVDMGKKLCVCA